YPTNDTITVKIVRLKDGQTVYTYTPIPSNKWWGDMINIPDIVPIVNNTPGIYKVELTVGGQTMAVDYFFYAVDTLNSSVICDKEEYYSYEPMNISYTIDPYDNSHSYYLVIYDSLGNKINRVEVKGSSGYKIVKAPLDGGTYFVVLERDDGVQYAYDTFSVKEEVVFRGYVKDQNGNPLANASVSFEQNGKYYNATTDANGYYEVTGLLANVDVKAKASLSGYESDERTFKVDVAGIHYVNFTLINSSKIKGIYGIVRKEPFGNPVEGAKVTIFNSTWSAETYSNAAGFYNIIPPSFGRYTIRIEKTRFETVEYVVDYNYTYQTILDEKYIPLNSTWNVVVSPSDAPVIDWAYPGYINQYAVNISNTLGDYGTPRYGYIYKNITIQNPKLLKFYVKYWVNTWAPPIGVRVKQNGNVITERYVKGGGTAKSSDWTLEQLNLTNLNNFTVEIFLEDLSTTYAGYDDHGE
ncbi:carboxypeptidase regulatory-like domain-containing protein, partial [Archaeoglobus sp.]